MSLIRPAQKLRGAYQNPVPTISGLKRGSTVGLMWNFFFADKAAREPKAPLGPFVTDPASLVQPQQGIRVTWMGHSSVLLELSGRRILFDPVWGNRASPFSFAGPKRFFAPPIALNRLPKLDAIVLSHDHYDHLDASTWRMLARGPRVPVFTSLGVGKHLRNFGYPADLVTDLDWTSTATLAPDTRLTCLPSRHFSGRSLLNRNGTLWSSFAIKTSQHNVYFGADSGPFEDGFREIGEQYGPFDLTMLEIGAYGDQWPDIHMGPEHALNAHKLLRGRILFPIHWGTFNLALHPWKEPVERILPLAAQQEVKLLLPKPGVPTQVAEHVSNWWRI